MIRGKFGQGTSAAVVKVVFVVVVIRGLTLDPSPTADVLCALFGIHISDNHVSLLMQLAQLKLRKFCLKV